MEFEKACSEMNYIIEHMNPMDMQKIPQRVIEFFKNNRSITYKVKLDNTQNLYEQELMEETKAFIEIINTQYLLNQNKQKKEELTSIINNEIEEPIGQGNTQNSMIIYKENIILNWLKKYLRKLKKFTRSARDEKK